MKKAILAVSFGTTYHNTLEKTIAAIEADLAAAFPNRTLRRAFTSGMIIRRLKERDGLAIDNVAEALERLAAEGFEDVVLQSTHVMNGDERDKMMAQAMPFASRFTRLSIGSPLLTETEDYFAAAKALLERLPGLEEQRQELADKARYFRDCLTAEGLTVRGDAHILALPVGDAAACGLRMSIIIASPAPSISPLSS